MLNHNNNTENGMPLTKTNTNTYNFIKRRVRRNAKQSLMQARILNGILSATLIIVYIFAIANSRELNASLNELSAKYENLSEKYQSVKTETIIVTVENRNKENVNTTVSVAGRYENLGTTITPETVVIEETSSTSEEPMDIVPDKFNDIPLDEDLKEYIYTSAIEADIPAEIMFSMAWKESRYNPDAKSNTSDHGLFQINEINFSRLAKQFGYTEDEFEEKIYDPYLNTDCAIYIISECRDKYSNTNWHHVLMRYNLGPTGASKQFASGKYSTTYSRDIVSHAQNTFKLADISLS